MKENQQIKKEIRRNNTRKERSNSPPPGKEINM